GLLPAGNSSDPLIAACIGIAASQSRWHSLSPAGDEPARSGNGDRLQRWTAALFPDLDGRAHRLHRAACWLSDIAWAEHPDYRAAHAFARSLTLPVAQIGHAERVFLASALHARYGGA